MQTNVRDYPSRLGDSASKYLPRFDAQAVEKQLEYLVGRELTPMVEHVEPRRAASRYWYMWRLPLFGVCDPAAIRAEIDACARANPTHHVRLIGFDPRRQTQVVAFVVSRGEATA